MTSSSPPLGTPGLAEDASRPSPTARAVACEPTTTLLRRMDTRKVLVTPEEPLTAAPTLAGFETSLLKSGGFAVSYRTGQSSVEQVLAAIRAAGLHIKDISTEDPDLEDVFVSLTYAAEQA